MNTLSDFSRKARTKGTRDISVLYAFDLEAQKTVCSKCFPGNMLDVTAYGAFMEECGIEKGLVVADREFPARAAAENRARHPGLHYLNPVKRNSRFIETHRLLEFDAPVPDWAGVLGRKVRWPVGEWCLIKLPPFTGNRPPRPLSPSVTATASAT